MRQFAGGPLDQVAYQFDITPHRDVDLATYELATGRARGDLHMDAKARPVTAHMDGSQRLLAMINLAANKVLEDPIIKNFQQVRRDGSVKLIPEANIRTGVSRVMSLVNAEPTDLYHKDAMALMRMHDKNPNFEGVPYQTLLNAVLQPLNTTQAQMKLRRGFADGELHHNVGVAGVDRFTQNLDFGTHGEVITRTALESPYSSTSGGYITASDVGHNIAHYDPVSRQFFKGADAKNAEPIDMDVSAEEAQKVLSRYINNAKEVSARGIAADSAQFYPVLAEKMSQQAGVKIAPEELDSAFQSVGTRSNRPTDAGSIKKHSNSKMVKEAMVEAYGSDVGSIGAANWMKQNGHGDLLATAEELNQITKDRAKEARLRKKAGTKVEPASSPVILRPGIQEVLASSGVNLDNVMNSKLRPRF